MKELTTKNIPDAPGVYLFRGKRRALLYVGKATSLRTRVQSYFRSDLMTTRGPIIVAMIEATESIDFIETDSVLEALILEANLIKKLEPPYNTKEKDNKSFNFVVITKEKFPRILIMRGRELSESDLKPKTSNLKAVFGPFPQGSVLKEALRIVRKMFPFRDKCSPANLFDKTLGVKNKSQQKRLAGKLHSNKPCFNAQIGLCPGVCAGTVSARDYARTIQHIKLFFEGRKSTLIASLKRDMKRAAKELRFEEASRIKKTLFALSHIQDIALLKQVLPRSSASVPHNSASFRIEAYDTAHISGTNTVGVMVVLENNEPKKSDYRKFKIRTSTNDDIASLREILSRRFTHTEWPMPNLLVIDGGKGQVNAAEKALAEWGIVIPVVGVVKDERHRPREIIGNMSARKNYERAILLANSEAHRFAIAYHRNMRRKIK